MATLTSEMPKPAAAAARLYQSDPYAWGIQQAAALRRRDADAIDWDNVIEEIEGMANIHRDKWVAHCAQAVHHLLKIQHWRPGEHEDPRKTAGLLKKWAKEVRNFRNEMAAAVRASPSLQGSREEMLDIAWLHGRTLASDSLADLAAKEAGAEDDRKYAKLWDAKLPEECPYFVEHVAAYDPKLHRIPSGDIWPPEVASRLNKELGWDLEMQRPPRRAPGVGLRRSRHLGGRGR